MNERQRLTKLDELLEGIPKHTDLILEAPKLDYRPEDVFRTAKLTPLTRKVMERWYAKNEKKRLGKANRKRTKYRGRYHHARKAMVERLRKEQRWATNPFGCLINTRGRWALDRKKWDSYIAPLWEKYDPKDLKIKKAPRAGTAEEPYTVYNLQVVHRTLGVLYDGNSQLIYDVSSGSL
jgi:hypothetical protein